MPYSRVMTLCLFLGLAFPLRAQETGSGDQAKLIRELLSRIERLENRLAELESAGSRPAPAPAGAELPAAAAARSGLEPAPVTTKSPAAAAAAASTEAQPRYPALHIAGFSDFNLVASDQHGSRAGFEEGQFVLHLSTPLSSRVSFFSELTLSARKDAGTGSPPAEGFNAEVERVMVRFEQSDYFKLSFGRFHTPINYWNTAFHHGQWLQTTVGRPEMTQFGGQFIPVHFVGALLEGAHPAGGMNVNYNVGIGNGRGSVISRDGDAGDANNNRSWLVNLYSKPDRLYGLQFGGSVYRDKVTLANGRNFREWITSGHLVWMREDPEFIAEIANVRHQEIGKNLITNNLAYYTQLGYRFPGSAKAFKPYYRFEYIHIPQSDMVFQTVPNLAGSVVGVRYDISSFVAFKFEYRNQRRAPGLPRTNSGFFQTSFTF